MDTREELREDIRRHAALVGLFISVSELVQALADIDFETGGIDIFSPRQQQGARLLVGLAAEVARSWRNGGSRRGDAEGRSRVTSARMCPLSVSSAVTR